MFVQVFCLEIFCLLVVPLAILRVDPVKVPMDRRVVFSLMYGIARRRVSNLGIIAPRAERTAACDNAAYAA